MHPMRRTGEARLKVFKASRIVQRVKPWRVAIFHSGFCMYVPNTHWTEGPRPEAVFIQTGGTDFNTLVKTRLAFQRFQVAVSRPHFVETIQPSSWTEHALNSVGTALNEDRNVSPRVRNMVDSLKTDPPVLILCSLVLPTASASFAVRSICPVRSDYKSSQFRITA
jgi:hypothetical protein